MSVSCILHAPYYVSFRNLFGCDILFRIISLKGQFSGRKNISNKNICSDFLNKFLCAKFFNITQRDIIVNVLRSCGPGSSVGIATELPGWTVRGLNRGEGEIFRTRPDRPWGPPSLLYNGYRVFPGRKERPGRDADPSPPSNTVVKKE